MNYDRFLTRVFDKLEKKMLYKWDKHCFGKPDYPGLMKFITCCDGFMICEFMAGNEAGAVPALEFIEFKDRFVPMRCTGKKDKNNQLMYADDVILYEHEKYKGIITDLGDVFRVREKNFYKDFPVLGCQQLIGNRWENEKLWEAKA